MSTASRSHKSSSGGGHFTTGRHGAKKQKLTSQSKQLIQQTRSQHAHNERVTSRAHKLAVKKAKRREGVARVPYSRFHHILTIGEGNFSFTRALINEFVRQETAAATATIADPSRDDDNDDDDGDDGGDDEDVAVASAAIQNGQNDEETESADQKPRRKRVRQSFAPRDAASQTPLPPSTLFTHPSFRVVASCYDSFSQLCQKYPHGDATSQIEALLDEDIPIYTSVDAVHLDRAKKQGRITHEMVERAKQKEKEERQKRTNGIESKEEEENLTEDEEDAPMTSDISSPLFPLFVTRQQLFAYEKDLKSKLHGSQKRKYQERLEADRAEAKLEAEKKAADETSMTPASAIDVPESMSASSKRNKRKKKSAPVAAASKPTSSSALLTQSKLHRINAEPRTRFHRVIFNFPHTGCGIKDTEENNKHHKDFLRAVFTNIGETRVVYPAEQGGEVHVTLKRGEPYRSWNIVRTISSLPGWKFKTSWEFLPSLYAGYEHRRTRGGFDETSIDLMSGEAHAANDDISGGSMTYVFTRERTWQDEEEAKYDTEWMTRYQVDHEAEQTRVALLAECDRIYKDTKAKHGEHVSTSLTTNDTTGNQDTTDETMEEEEKEEKSGDDGEDVENGNEQDGEKDEEDDHDDNENVVSSSSSRVGAPPSKRVKTSHSSGTGRSETTDEEEKPKLIPGLAAAFKQHFQARSTAQPVAAAINKAKFTFKGKQKKRT